ncbi:MAG: ATP-binding cassette domain-containing protein [Lewinella sp.]|nr:ATP-binding cassette domain-containing protein [Lewinella sp.]
MEYILEINQVRKTYGPKVAVDDVSLRVPRASIFGLLGPNGAGKTSLIRMITTITRPDSGHIRLMGEPLSAHHPELIGYLPEERGLYRRMRVGEHLLYLGRLKGMTKDQATTAASRWLEKLELMDRWDQPVETLSKGLQQQVQFVATVLHDPPLLILDEPFSGLDPVNTNRLKDEIRQLARQGVTIIFSTHRMEQVEEICQYIALIDKGQTVLEGPVPEVRQRFKRHHYELKYRGTLPPNFVDQFSVVDQGDQCAMLAWPPDQPSNELLTALLQQGIEIQSFSELLPSLNEIFIQQVRKVANIATT